MAEDSPALEGGLRPGDVIIEANGEKVDEVEDVDRIIKTEGKEKGVVMFLIVRDGHNLFRTIPVQA